MPLVLYSPVAGIKAEDLGVPLVSSIGGVLAGYTLPGWFDANYPDFKLGPFNAGDVATILIFLGALGVASYSKDPMVKTVSILLGCTAVAIRAVIRASEYFRRT